VSGAGLRGRKNPRFLGSFFNQLLLKARLRTLRRWKEKHKHLPPRLGDQQVFVITVKLSARKIL
jgi:hypothetical protein